MSNVSESGGLIATVDSLFGIIQSPSMRAENVYYLKAVAIRNSGHMGDRKKYDFVQKYLRITENTTEDIIQENMSLPSLNKDNTKLQTKTFNNNFNQQPQIQQPQIMPQLGISEVQISGKDLFNL